MAAVCCPPSTVSAALWPGVAASSSKNFPLRRGVSLKWSGSSDCRRWVVETRRQGGGGGGRGRGRGGVRAGLPVISSVPVVGPLANAIFNPVLLFIVYAAGAVRFYSGFRKTTYADSSATKISMTALWPVLFLASKAYRDNFKKAIS